MRTVRRLPGRQGEGLLVFWRRHAEPAPAQRADGWRRRTSSSGPGARRASGGGRCGHRRRDTAPAAGWVLAKASAPLFPTPGDMAEGSNFSNDSGLLSVRRRRSPPRGDGKSSNPSTPFGRLAPHPGVGGTHPAGADHARRAKEAREHRRERGQAHARTGEVGQEEKQDSWHDAPDPERRPNPVRSEPPRQTERRGAPAPAPGAGPLPPRKAWGACRTGSAVSSQNPYGERGQRAGDLRPPIGGDSSGARASLRRAQPPQGGRAASQRRGNSKYGAVHKIGDSPPETAQSGGESEEGRRPAPLGRVPAPEAWVRGEGRELAGCLVQGRGPCPRTKQRGRRWCHQSALLSNNDTRLCYDPGR
jgi:hypothetical protein